MLRHKDICGTLELSTEYSWTDASEVLKVNTGTGLYELYRMERLCLALKPAVIAGIPLEKTGFGNTGTRVLFEQNSFSPVLTQNQVYTQGFFDEVRNFALRVEGKKGDALTDLASLRDTYQLLDCLA